MCIPFVMTQLRIKSLPSILRNKESAGWIHLRGPMLSGNLLIRECSSAGRVTGGVEPEGESVHSTSVQHHARGRYSIQRGRVVCTERLDAHGVSGGADLPWFAMPHGIAELVHMPRSRRVNLDAHGFSCTCITGVIDAGCVHTRRAQIEQVQRDRTCGTAASGTCARSRAARSGRAMMIAKTNAIQPWGAALDTGRDAAFSCKASTVCTQARRVHRPNGGPRCIHGCGSRTRSLT